MSDYRIERINERSFGAIRELYQKSFGLEVSEDELKKKYDTSAFGEQFVGFLAYHELLNEPAAYYGVFPLQFFQDGKSYLVAQSGDTMTAPNHQKKGLFIQLATKTYELAKDLGVDFVFGFPNENSLPGFKRKLNWQFYDTMYDFQFITSGLPLLQLASKKKLFKPIYSWCTHSSFSKISFNYDSRTALQWSPGLKRDTAFFEYKKNRNVQLVQLNGFSMAIKAENHLYIGEVSQFENEKLPFFIETIKQLGRKFYSRKVVLTLSKNHWLFSLLSESVQPKASLPIGFLPLNVEKCESIDFSKIIFSRLDYDTF